MAHTERQITDDITTYFQKSGGRLKDWYVGIAKDPRQRLFVEHSVPEKEGLWIYRQALSSVSARNVEQLLIEAGFDGGLGGGDANTDYVYAYQKIPGITDP